MQEIENMVRGAYLFQTNTLKRNKSDAINHLRKCFTSTAAQEVLDKIETEHA